MSENKIDSRFYKGIEYVIDLDADINSGDSYWDEYPHWEDNYIGICNNPIALDEGTYKIIERKNMKKEAIDIICSIESKHSRDRFLN